VLNTVGGWAEAIAADPNPSGSYQSAATGSWKQSKGIKMYYNEGNWSTKSWYAGEIEKYKKLITDSGGDVTRLAGTHEQLVVTAWRDLIGAASAPIVAEGEKGEVLKIGEHAVYPYKKGAQVNLVIFYHGMGYGTQDYVLGKLKEMNLGPFMFIIPGSSDGKGYRTPIGEANGPIQVVQKLKTDHEIKVSEMRLGGWSGGSIGFMTAFQPSGEQIYDFKRYYLADPSPERSAFGSDQTKIPKNAPFLYMEYNPNNWKKPPNAADLSGRLEQLAQKIKSAGGNIKKTSNSHKKILEIILGEIIK
jgi:hypothetical protein